MRELPRIQRQTVNTGHFMRSFFSLAASPDANREDPAPESAVDEWVGTLARISAYLCAVGLIAVIGIHLGRHLPPGAGGERQPSWRLASRSTPAFAVNEPDLGDKSTDYEIFRGPGGGRKDVFRFAVRGENNDPRLVAGLEIYRPGAEFSASAETTAELAGAMAAGAREAAGVIDSKFGAVKLFRLADAAASAPPCLGFIKGFDDPLLRISGWSCEGQTVPARRAALGCMLDRLTPLGTGNDPKMAAFFARAELRRGSCGTIAGHGSADWVTTAEGPELRGAF